MPIDCRYDDPNLRPLLWQIPRLKPVCRGGSKGRKPATRIVKHLRTAFYLHLRFLYTWMQVRREMSAQNAKLRIEADMAAGRVEGRYRERRDAGEPRGTNGAVQGTRGHNLQGPKGLKKYFEAAVKHIPENTPLRDLDELRAWFGGDEIAYFGAEPLLDLQVQQQRYIHTVVLLERTWARAYELQNELLWDPKKYRREWEDVDVTSKEKVIEHVALRREGHAESMNAEYAPLSLHDAFLIATTAWINPADLWSRFGCYRPAFDVAVLVGRVRHGFETRFDDAQLDVLLRLLGIVEGEPNKYPRNDACLNPKWPESGPPRPRDELNVDRRRIVRELEYMLRRVLDDYDEFQNDVYLEWARGEPFFDLWPRKAMEYRGNPEVA